MDLQVKDLTIEDMKFQLRRLPALEALKLDKQMATLLLPVLSGLKGLDLDKDLDIGAMIKGLTDALNDMEGDKFIAFVVALLKGVVYSPPEGSSIELDKASINTAFQNSENGIQILYKLIFEVMKFNKFSPFALVGGGKGIMKMFTSLKPKTEQKQNGSKSETSADLLGN